MYNLYVLALNTFVLISWLNDEIQPLCKSFTRTVAVLYHWDESFRMQSLKDIQGQSYIFGLLQSVSVYPYTYLSLLMQLLNLT